MGKERTIGRNSVNSKVKLVKLEAEQAQHPWAAEEQHEKSLIFRA